MSLFLNKNMYYWISRLNINYLAWILIIIVTETLPPIQFRKTFFKILDCKGQVKPNQKDDSSNCGKTLMSREMVQNNSDWLSTQLEFTKWKPSFPYIPLCRASLWSSISKITLMFPTGISSLEYLFMVFSTKKPTWIKIYGTILGEKVQRSLYPGSLWKSFFGVHNSCKARWAN